jgi:hypothetical protein
LDSKSDETAPHAGKWTVEEESILMDAVEKQKGEEWADIAALVPGRTKQQCWHRWNGILESKKNETIARAGKWTAEEESALKDAVEKYNGEDWAAISELVPGRAKQQQCWHRWNCILDSSKKKNETIARTGIWTTEEDITLRDAVEKHNGTDWAAISELVPGRTKRQCNKRWHKCIKDGTCPTLSKSDATRDRTCG